MLPESTSSTISEHALVLLVVDRLLSCVKNQLLNIFDDIEGLTEFVSDSIRFFDSASIATSIENANSHFELKSNPIQWFQTVVFSETTKIVRFLRDTTLVGNNSAYSGATSGYHDFLLPFVRRFQQLKILNGATTYVLLDDADRLTKTQQGIVNEWIANRDNSILCIKVFSRRDHYRTMSTRSGSTLEQPHDYSEVNVDELYTRSTSDYWKKVELISNRRLTVAKSAAETIQCLLPADSTEAGLFEQVKAKTADEWEAAGKPGRQGDYVNRYAIPRLFQHLRASKKRKSYAGFDNLVDISSGVVRDFLEPCYLMFDRVVSGGTKPSEVSEIPSSIQDEVIYSYSEAFLLNRIEDLRQELPPEEWSRLDSLRCLVESLGRLFYARLHDAASREARIFSFTVRGSVNNEIAEVLRLGVRYRYLQHGTYSTKEGGGRENWYILSRRLCPMYKLDPSGFEGRISLTNEMLELACKKPDEFVRRRLRLRDESNTGPWLFEEMEKDGED